MNPIVIFSVLLAVLSVVSVFVEIPFVTQYAFWFLFASWVIAISKGA